MVDIFPRTRRIAVDMFPQTQRGIKWEKCDKDILPIISSHVETAVLLVRKP